VSLVLIGYRRFAAPASMSGSALADALATLHIPLVTRVLYGGIVEEVPTRWGFVSLFAWLVWRARGCPSPVGRVTYVGAIVAAALLFAIGHLPVLFAMAASPPLWLVATVVAGNAVPGVAFGWLFWRRGLESAMLAHATAHGLAAMAGS
jgi:hypothetical protein